MNIVDIVENIDDVRRQSDNLTDKQYEALCEARGILVFLSDEGVNNSAALEDQFYDIHGIEQSYRDLSERFLVAKPAGKSGSGTAWKCPHCGKRVITYDRHCRKCGERLKW